tara:strand:+ start:203 stop:757 length:555 start_codon:yes stop_codon:yes gene_type:complete
MKYVVIVIIVLVALVSFVVFDVATCNNGNSENCARDCVTNGDCKRSDVGCLNKHESFYTFFQDNTRIIDSYGGYSCECVSNICTKTYPYDDFEMELAKVYCMDNGTILSVFIRNTGSENIDASAISIYYNDVSAGNNDIIIPANNQAIPLNFDLSENSFINECVSGNSVKAIGPDGIMHERVLA